LVPDTHNLNCVDIGGFANVAHTDLSITEKSEILWQIKKTELKI